VVTLRDEFNPTKTEMFQLIVPKRTLQAPKVEYHLARLEQELSKWISHKSVTLHLFSTIFNRKAFAAVNSSSVTLRRKTFGRQEVGDMEALAN
jgi:hypothetical protein